MNDDIDFEDLECRLYSQVYHSNIEDDETNLQSELNLNIHVNDKAHNNRYFSKRVSDQSVFIPLEEVNSTNSEKIYSSIYNNISFNPTSTAITTEGNFPKQFQNNITVNQYTVPFILNTELSEVLNPNCANILVTRSIKNKKKLERKIRRSRRLERRKRNRERRNRNNANAKSIGDIQTSHIIFISDGSDGECVIVKDMCKKTPRKGKSSPCKPLENSGYESENDIIYVPPPPVEIINVDVDIEEYSANTNEVPDNPILSSNSPQTCSNELSNTPESCAANDFLDNSGLENNSSNFNFSLHGSDFNNAGDFLRPANPVEYCETESSCSTNDLNRENNSVKTIVFNEVDFPREDIFSDKNLEGFSSYITPKRNQKKKKLNELSKSTMTFSEDVSSPTSSESDYEPPDIVNKSIKGVDKDSFKKLPTLSPMQCEKVVTASKKLNKKKLEINSVEQKKLSSKRKSNNLERTESDSDNQENQLMKKLPKGKKRNISKKRNSSEETDKNLQIQNKNSNTDTVLDEENVHAKDVNNEEYSDSINESIENNDTNRNKGKKKKKNKKHEDDNNTNSNLMDINSEKTKRKKRRSLSSENIVCDGSTGESNESLLGQINTIANDNVISDQRDIHSLQDIPDNISVSPEPTVDKIKRKKKKSVSETLVNNVNVNICEINNSSHITHTDSENGLSISKDLSHHKVKKSTGRDTSEIHDETPKNSSVILHSEDSNERNANKAISRNEVHNTENISPNPCTSQRLSLLNEIGEDIIVIDEVGSDNDDAEIIVSSGSESDFEYLCDVGNDLELANCTVNDGNTPNPQEIIDDDNSSMDFTSLYVKNKNLCEDYSKFDIEHIQSTQSDDPEAWKILPLDQFDILNFNRKKGPRCSRCRQFGHFAVRCVDKPYPPSCSLCGDPGHQEPRCPNKICNQCGNEGDYSTTFCWKCVKFRNLICRLCDMNGHIANTCPDLWRRYHLTTEEGPIVESQHPQLKPRDQLWCSGCAGHGHLEHECNSYIRQYPPSNPCIISYKDVLHEADRNSRQNEIPLPTPPPIITAPQQTNYLLPTPLPSFSSSSQNVPFGTPLFIPPLMSQLTNLNPVFPIPTILNQNQIVIPNNNINHNQNFPPAPTRVLNPFSLYVQQEEKNISHTVLDRMMMDYVNDSNNVNNIINLPSYHTEKGKTMLKHTTSQLIRNNQKRVRQIIMVMPPNVVFEFLSKEMADLENVVSQSDPRYLKKKLVKCHNILNKKGLNCNIVKEKCFWYRIINIFIFGVHQMKDGNLHIHYIKRYLSEPKSNRMDANKRKSLLHAYNYIFDPNQRYYINYYRIMQQLIRKQINRNE